MQHVCMCNLPICQGAGQGTVTHGIHRASVYILLEQTFFFFVTPVQGVVGRPLGGSFIRYIK